ncbi:MAG TPA: nuclear transport factor 2 family protein [Gemmatimonadaceae bacterium]|nr:nuclear transport factor 2 family protein [Gemmatimonadaceae bacterium]
MTTAAPTTTTAVAEELVSLCREGRNIDAIKNFYSPEIVSVESMGNETMPREMKGLDAIMEKNRWWSENNTVNSARVEGPFVGDGDKFAVYYNFDVTSKQTGKRQEMEEMALYTVKDGKVVHEHFFYKTGP